MKLSTKRFGVIDVSDSSVMVIPQGLIGFPTLTRWAIIDDAGGSPFRWWQSLDEVTTVLVTIDPFLLVDYDLQAVEEELHASGIGTSSERIVAVVVTLRGPTLDGATVNLVAPIVVNGETHIGRQMILPEGRYLVDQPLEGVRSEKRSIEMAA